MPERDLYKFGSLYPFSSPLFFRRTTSRASEIGAAQAISERFKQAEVNISINGDTERWSETGESVLLMGEHSNRLDDLMVLLAFAEMGRYDIRFTARPYSPLNHLFNRLRANESDHMIPFLPRNMSRERPGRTIEEKIIKYKLRDHLPNDDEIQELNRTSIRQCVNLLQEGHAVNIFPGGQKSNSSLPWKKGVGEIIKAISPESRDNVMLVPYRIEGISEMRIALAHMRRIPKPQNIIIHCGRQGTIDELFLGSNSVDNLSPSQITNVIETDFRNHFYS